MAIFRKSKASVVLPVEIEALVGSDQALRRIVAENLEGLQRELASGPERLFALGPRNLGGSALVALTDKRVFALEKNKIYYGASFLWSEIHDIKTMENSVRGYWSLDITSKKFYLDYRPNDDMRLIEARVSIDAETRRPISELRAQIEPLVADGVMQ